VQGILLLAIFLLIPILKSMFSDKVVFIQVGSSACRFDRREKSQDSSPAFGKTTARILAGRRTMAKMTS
jgi:hypothetical protein